MKQLSPSQQRFWKLLLQNDGEWFLRGKLPLLLGYTSDDGLRHAVDFPELERRRLIESRRMGKELAYRTNIRTRIGGQI